MYGSNITLPRGSILSYEDAVQRHDSIKPIRGRHVDTRPLGRRSNDNFTILRLNDDSIAVRLYRTDIITYRPGGTIELEPYSSRLTNDAVRQILGRRVSPNYTNGVGPVLWVKEKGYRISGSAILDEDFNLVAGSTPFTRYSMDRKRSNKALKEAGFYQFSLWLRTQLRIGIDPRQGDRWSGQYISDTAVRCLDEPVYYADIVREWSAYKHVNDQLSALRFRVQKYHDCIVQTELPYVNGWRELASVEAGYRKYG